MDLLGSDTGKKYLARRHRLPDGSVITITRGLQKRKRKKIVVARGKGRYSIGNVMTSQLLPFKKSMAKQLNKRGIYASHLELKRLIPLYYNQFVSSEVNSNNFFQPINSYEFVNHIAYRICPKDNLNGDITDFRNLNEFNNLDNVITNIIDVFRTAKLKKRSVLLRGGNSFEVLTDEELEQARTAERVERHLEAKALNDESVRTGTLKNIIIIGVVVFLLWHFLK